MVLHRTWCLALPDRSSSTRTQRRVDAAQKQQLIYLNDETSLQRNQSNQAKQGICALAKRLQILVNVNRIRIRRRSRLWLRSAASLNSCRRRHESLRRPGLSLKGSHCVGLFLLGTDGAVAAVLLAASQGLRSDEADVRAVILLAACSIQIDFQHTCTAPGRFS